MARSVDLRVFGAQEDVAALRARCPRGRFPEDGAAAPVREGPRTLSEREVEALRSMSTLELADAMQADCDAFERGDPEPSRVLQRARARACAKA